MNVYIFSILSIWRVGEFLCLIYFYLLSVSAAFAMICYVYLSSMGSWLNVNNIRYCGIWKMEWNEVETEQKAIENAKNKREEKTLCHLSKQRKSLMEKFKINKFWSLLADYGNQIHVRECGVPWQWLLISLLEDLWIFPNRFPLNSTGNWIKNKKLIFVHTYSKSK